MGIRTANIKDAIYSFWQKWQVFANKREKKTQEGVKTGTKVFFNELLMEL
jgi:hypothetical protein